MEQAAISSGYRQRIFSELVARQGRNPAYSLRSYARDLGMSPTTLSRLFNGKRRLSVRNVKRVAVRLGFAPQETQAAVAEVQNGRPNGLADGAYTTLSDDIFKSLSDWYYFAILSLADSGRAKACPAWISQRLNLTEFQAADALERLLRLELVTAQKGKLRATGKSFRVPSDIPSAAARRLQHDHLKLAQTSLEKDAIGERDMTSMTMLANAKQLPEAKRMIKTFRRRLARHLENRGTGNRVYVLSVQLFPVSDGRLK